MTPPLAAGATRRSFFLGSFAALALSGCTMTAPTPPVTTDRFERRIRNLEDRSGVTIAVSAARIGSDRKVQHRAGDAMPMCSLFKIIAVTQLVAERGYDQQYWDTPIPYTAADVVENSPVTSVSKPMALTPGELADAALRFSDNTAGNIVMREIGGPPAVTRMAASLGAAMTRLDRIEPELNQGLPGDLRDTTTADDMVAILRTVLIEGAVGELARSKLQDWMLRNTTSGERSRAGLSASFELADKTGAGSYGIVNDAGILYPARGDAIAFCILTRTDDRNAEGNNGVVADTTRLLVAELA